MIIRVFLAALLAAGIWLAGCEVSDPGSALENQPPTTSLTVAPADTDTVNHYITLGWAGNDADGEVEGFNLYVDGSLLSFTERSDTTIAFTAPTDGTPEQHRFKVQAVDNRGLADPEPPECMFYVINFAPSVVFTTVGSVPNGAAVSRGFRLTLAASDSNRSPILFSVSLDDSVNGWTEWSPDSIYLFCDTSLGLFPERTIQINSTELNTGAHTLYARVKDAGNAESEVLARRSFVIADTNRPAMEAVEGAYGSDEFYPDGSVYWRSNRLTQITFSARANLYRGEINAYRIEESGVWAEWTTEPLLEYENLPEGEYPFRFTARDLAGAMADTLEYTIRIVKQRLCDSIIVVDETRDGTGANPFTPDDQMVDVVYDQLLTGYNYRQVDYASRGLGTEFISPYDLYNAGLVFWHADDKASFNLGTDANTGVLTEFLDRGGRLIVCGWNLVNAFSPGLSSVEYDEGDFPRDYLRMFTAERTADGLKITSGFEGVDPFPSVSIDPDIVPASWNGRIDLAWSFLPRGECTVIGELVVDNDDPLNGRPAAYFYDLSFRVAVIGLPLYFCDVGEAKDFVDVLIPRMQAGLPPCQ